jgi:hypothetical protein
MPLIIPTTSGLNVDARYVGTFAPNLYHNTWMVPGVTFTDKYKTGPAGQIMVHKLSSTGETVPGTPGRDFSHVNAVDSLIPILLNNNFMESDKAYAVALNSIDANVADQMLTEVTNKIQGGYNMSGLACLVTEGTAGTGSALTASNIRSEIIAARTAIVKKKARANVVLCSPETYGLILDAAGAAFTPTINDRMTNDGQVGRWLGLNFIEVSGLSAANAKYYDSTGTQKTATFSGIDFIMYDYEAFSAVSNLEVFRLIDGGKDFNGTLAQGELNTGYRVTNAERVYVRKTA